MGWSLYFTLLEMVEEEYFKFSRFHKLSDSGFVLHHIDGGLFQLSPDDRFVEIFPKQHTIITLRTNGVILRHFVMPRWYTVGLDDKAHVIWNTDDNALKFVTRTETQHSMDENHSNQIQSYSRSPKQRFAKYSAEDLKEAPMRILPKPRYSKLSDSETILIARAGWFACGNVSYFKNELKELSEFFKVEPKVVTACPPSDFIRFIQKRVSEKSNEAYRIRIVKTGPAIEIAAETNAGAFYAVQSLKSLSDCDKLHQTLLPTGEILDWPKYPYRGLFLDVARNFVKTEDVITLIETMALYKLNKLHLHLTDDEGWRLEIDELPELTQVASVRQHSPRKHESLIPLLGSGPFANNTGSGYYNKSEYLQILHCASANHVEVIPEVDVPGHSRAAIKAMEARYHRYMEDKNEEKALEFLVSDFDDNPTVKSVQSYRGNALNPCMNSTYRFLDVVIKSIKDLHEPVQPLKTIHIGGDEVKRKIWWRSPICKNLLKKSRRFPKTQEDLREYFFRKICHICSQKHGLQVGAWADAALQYASSNHFSMSSLGGANVTAYDWNSHNNQLFNLIASGYKTVLSTARYLYFDHPSEPNPDEIGMIWAGEAVEDRTVFGFTQDKVLPQTNASIAVENIVGMQAHIWSEFLRGTTMVHYQLFPRLLALAERAWYKAPWEDMADREKKQKMEYLDWVQFINVVGYKELPRLKRKKIEYRIPPPGFWMQGDRLYIASLYPGFTFKCRILLPTSSTSDWFPCHYGQTIKYKRGTFQMLATDNWRESKIVEMR